VDRIGTGNPQLDRILDGGLPANAIHVVMGPPGSGKTILAEQLAFANASKERPALYLTTVSEPLPKFLSYLQEYSFAHPSRVGTEVLYTSLGEALAERPERLSELVTELVQQHRPRVLVIDSFKAVGELMPDLGTWRRQLHGLAGLLSAYRATTIWVGEYTPDQKAQLPEFAVADGIVELTREQHGSRDFRFFRVMKLRGSAFLDGYHALHITRAGLDVFPRLRTPAVAIDYHPADERLSTGIAGLDEMVATGWLRGTTTILVGPSGAGKTVMGMHFLREGVRCGEPSLLVTFEENPVQLARVMGHFGWEPASLVGPGKLDIFYASPVELQIDTVVRELFGRIEERGVRRVVIDGVADLASTADDPVRVRDYLFALTQHFAARNVTSMLTVETSASTARGLTRHGISYVGDNLLLLEMHLGEELTRTIRVLKTRGSAHDGRRRPLAIEAEGIVVK
jgi:circadian clock protein KaiC